MTSISIPASVEVIGEGAFNGCSSLNSILIPFVGRTNSSLGWEGSFGYIFGYDPYYGAFEVEQEYSIAYLPSSLQTVTVTNTWQIPDGAFANCHMLTEIYLTEQITSVGAAAFAGCSSLTEVLLPNITYIPQDLFYNCSSLTSFHIGEAVTSIGAYAFGGCSSLSCLVPINQGGTLEEGDFIIPDWVEMIEFGAFSGCSNMVTLLLPFVGSYDGATGDQALFGYIFGTDPGVGTTSVYQQADYENYYYIPSTLQCVMITNATSIGYHAFQNCTMLTDLFINPAAQSNADPEAYENCVAPTYF